MRKFLGVFLFSFTILSAQTGQLCFQTDKTKAFTPINFVCRDISPALGASLKSFNTATLIQTGTNPDGSPILAPKYGGIADLIFNNLADGLFTVILAQPAFQPATVVTAVAALTTAQVAATAAQATVIAKPGKVTDP
jgi:hypothetical protein